MLLKIIYHYLTRSNPMLEENEILRKEIEELKIENEKPIKY